MSEIQVSQAERAIRMAEEAIKERDRRIAQLEEALRDATSFMKLVLTLKTLTQGDEALSNSFKWLASLEAALSPSEAPPRSYKLELLELIAKQAETYLLVSTPKETRLEGPAMSERELKTSLQELKDLESNEAPEKEKEE